MMKSALKKRLEITGLWGIAVMGAICGCNRAPVAPAAKPSPPVAVQTVQPHRGEIARSITLPAFRVLPLKEATLYAKLSGYLKTLTVDKGDEVKEGHLLGQLEVPELLAEEAESKAEVAVARANFERMSEARQKAPDLVMPQTIDDLRGRWEVSQAKLQRTQMLLQYTRITAPFGGIITARFLDPGAFVPAATSSSTPQNAALVTLMDFTRVRVQVAVPEMEVPFITNGLPAQITLEELPGRVFPGSITRFAHALDPTTKTMLAEIELDNPHSHLRPGAYAMVKLEVERKKESLLVPSSALVIEKVGTSVFLLQNGRAKIQRVRIGFNDGVNVEVLEGLKPDQPILFPGKQPLTDGQAVTPLEAK